jgi:hypothetical protein
MQASISLKPICKGKAMPECARKGRAAAANPAPCPSVHVKAELQQQILREALTQPPASLSLPQLRHTAAYACPGGLWQGWARL